MKTIAGFLCFFFLAANLHAQDARSNTQGNARDASQDFVARSLKKGTWELGILGGGGSGLGKSDNAQFMYAGGRAGRILTADHLSGPFRGNFEWAFEALPVFTVFPPARAVYGGSFKPVIWQWNFTSHRKFVPYAAVAGGVLFTRENIPPGNTSRVNFTPQGSFGVQIFSRPGRALRLEISAVHISSASLGAQNPGYNGSIFFTIGFSWFKTPR
ncbi:MAG: acyloxyacyl hydrolase [Candidatus Acidiferrales bacterium]